jgi:hypothetical protein
MLHWLFRPAQWPKRRRELMREAPCKSPVVSWLAATDPLGTYSTTKAEMAHLSIALAGVETAGLLARWRPFSFPL